MGVSTRFQAVAGGSRALQGPPSRSRGLQGPPGASRGLSGGPGTLRGPKPQKTQHKRHFKRKVRPPRTLGEAEISCGMVGLHLCLQGGVEGVFKGI